MENRVLSAENSGVIIIDEAQKIISVNQATERIFGFQQRELVNTNLRLLFDDTAEDSGIFKGEIPEQPLELKAKNRSGKLFPVQVEFNVLKTNSLTEKILVITDLSARKRQQQKILELNSSLEQTVRERTETLNTTIESLKNEIAKRKKAESRIKENLRTAEELSELKTKFLSMVSHEFKTPLSAILTSATLASKYTTKEQTEKREKHLETIRVKVRYLNNILNDFLSIQRLESGKISYTMDDFPLSRVVNKVIYDSNMLSKEGQRIIYPDNIDNIILHYDEKILETALTNLINNSIKYSPEDSIIEVRVKTGKKSLCIEVADQGIGIPESEQKFIFNPYFRAGNVLTNQGTGIGLNIVKGHLENLKSSISFCSREGEGSLFWITIPYKKET